MSHSINWSDYYAPPLAAGTAIIPFYWGLTAKSDQQLGRKIQAITARQAAKGGLALAPPFAATLAIQMATQGAIERKIGGESPSYFSMFTSSAIVGGLSAPCAVMINSLSMRQSPIESVKRLTRTQTAAIAMRDGAFVLGCRLADPISVAMKERFGNSRSVEAVSFFVGGIFGSLAGHAGDTTLTLLQAGRRIEPALLMRGALIRGVTVGSIVTLYEFAKRALQSSQP